MEMGRGLWEALEGGVGEGSGLGKAVGNCGAVGEGAGVLVFGAFAVASALEAITNWIASTTAPATAEYPTTT